ncbi:50S ribosomal protein L21e [Thermoplasmatales archaeon ex4484_30]|nr:MAG: 50S ribosomal protein L21e [Thermoplasmatales archaeon ex4484_30]
MVKRSRGTRSKSRQILKKKTREKNANRITRALQEFKEGEKVSIVLDPSVQEGMPHPRFHGKTGDIEGKRGDAYAVKIRDGRKIKHIIARPEHLRKV